TFDDLQLQIGPDPNAPSGGIQNLSTAQENITKSFGRHTIKAGYNFTDVILSSFFVQRSRGDYGYASLQQYLLDQQPSGGNLSGVAGERSFGAATGVPEGFLQHSAYVNDDFRVRPNLTLNLGLRYEYVTVPVASRAQQFSSIANVPGGITFGNPKVSPNDWSPRIGFAYSPGKDQKWVVRGGVGRSFDLPYANLSVNANPAFYQVTQDVNSTNPVSNFLTNGGLTAAAPTVQTTASARHSLSAYTWDQNRPYAINGTLGVQRLLGKDYTIEARYVYTKGVHLYVQDRLNVVPQVTPNNFIPTFLSMPSAATFAGLTKTLGTTTTPGSVKGTIPAGATAALPYNEFATLGFGQAIVGFNPIGNSRYNGLAIQMNKRYSKNFSYQLAYTYSHAFDDSTATLFSTYFTPRRGQDFQNQAADWSNSALDHRHRLTFSPTYDLRIFESRGWVMKNVVGNWRFLGTYTYQTGEYATVQSGVDSNLNNDNAGDRTIINPAGQSNLGTGVTGYTSTGQVSTSSDGHDIVAYVANNPNARYVTAGVGALANAGRNTLLMPAINNFDVSVIKRFNLTERVHLELSGQFANLFNHPQYVGAWINDVAPNPNLISNGRNELVPSNVNFQNWSQFFTSNSRTIQVVGRIVF
ncbi:MAG TPA: TonB-dependent receptor, partial [Bryobacteraceae bacterium]|nr:TonB-dependent receptor [Bryobacteraceae bacterium]